MWAVTQATHRTALPLLRSPCSPLHDAIELIVENISVRLSDFGQFLRANGVEIDTGSVVDMQRIASLDMLRSRQQLMTGPVSYTHLRAH